MEQDPTQDAANETQTQTRYRLIAEEIGAYHVGSRSESSALLAWFLDVVWRMDPSDIEDAICDGTGDMGIDALVVDDDLKEITIIQSKHRLNEERTQGNTELQTQVGAAVYFDGPERIDQLVAATNNAELLQLLERLKIRERVADGAHVTRLVFVTNAALDANGAAYTEAMADRDPPLDVWDRARLAPVAERTRRPELREEQRILTAAVPPMASPLNDATELAVGLIDAEQLVRLPGIEDLSLFNRNVRLGLDRRTRINREIGDTVQRIAEHPLFPAYHNGLTMLTYGIEVAGNEIHLDGFTVVNGCQSLLTLHDNRTSLSPELKVLVKVVKVDRHSDLSDTITYRTNNQNPVDIRDQRSTDPIQRDLQAQVRDLYGDRLSYGIRAGERFTGDVLDNQAAAQLIMAVYLGEPWAAVRKVRLFDEDYRRIFNRSITGHRLYLLHLIDGVISSVRSELRDDLRASFASIRLTLAYLLGKVIELTPAGEALLQTPQRWLPEQTESVVDVFTDLARDIVESVNLYLESKEEEAQAKGENFDPKVAFKSRSGVGGVEQAVLSHSRRQARRDADFLFAVASLR